MSRRHSLRVPLLLAIALVLPLGGAAQVAQEAVDLDVVQRIRKEGLERSQLEAMARHLTEVIGPRLTGSPGMWAANQWTARTFREWGLANVTVEPWGEFGRGWQNEDYHGRILTPFEQPLHGQPLAWSGSTDGVVRGPVVALSVESVDDLARYRGRLAGAFLLADEPQDVTPEFDHRDRRASLESLLEPPEPQERPEMSEAER